MMVVYGKLQRDAALKVRAGVIAAGKVWERGLVVRWVSGPSGTETAWGRTFPSFEKKRR